MWNLVRTLIIALAFAGFLGQSMARATPLPVAADAMAMSADCAEMEMGADQSDPSDERGTPCGEMTPECMAQMGCTAVSPVFKHEPMLSHPSAGAAAAYERVVTRLAGTAPSPLRDPPRLQP